MFLVKVLILLVSLITVPISQAMGTDTRAPYPLEKAYTAMVQDGYSPELCAKISPQAINRAAFNSSGTQVYFERSACYFYAAATELNTIYCRQVREAEAWLLNGDYFAMSEWPSTRWAGMAWRSTTGFDHEALLRAAGFNEQDLADNVPAANPETAWVELYYSFKKSNDGSLQHRLKQLPDFSNE